MNIVGYVNNFLHLVFPESFIFVIFGLSAWGYGETILVWLHGNTRDALERNVLAVGLGYGVLGHLILLAGLTGLFVPSISWLALALGFGLAVFRVVRERILFKIPKRFSLLGIGLLVFIGIQLVFPLVTNALMPPLANDEIAYHLPIPQHYINAGRIIFIPFIPYSNWPLESEMLYALSLLVSGDLLAHLVSWGATIVTCLILISVGRRSGFTLAGLIASAVYAAAPSVQTLSGQAMVEPILAMFTSLSAYCLFVWVRDRSSAWWILSAVFGGLAASAKLNAVLTPVLLGGIFLLVLLFDKPLSLRRGVRLFFGYGCIAFLVVAPWYIKSWVQTGSPFWSFFQSFLPSLYWDALGSEYLIGYIQTTNLPLTIQNWFRLPWEILVNPGGYGGWSMSPGWSLVVLPILWLLGIWFSKDRRTLFVSVLAALLLYTAWFFTTHQSRFLMPVFPVFLSAGIIAYAGLSARWPRVVGIWLSGCLMLALVFSGWYSNPARTDLFKNRLMVAAGKQSRQEFLRANLRGYDALEYTNIELPPSSKLLMGLFEVRSYYLNHPYFWLNPMAQRILKLETYPNGSAFAVDVRGMGLTHVINNQQMPFDFERYPYGEKAMAVYSQFLRDECQLLYTAEGVEVYKIQP